jgi:hypothetical protein
MIIDALLNIRLALLYHNRRDVARWRHATP